MTLHLVLRGESAPPEVVLARLLAAAHEDFPVHAYVLMGTHAHLLASPRRPADVARACAALRARDCDATPVHARRYVLACMRYIELNPVRAAMVRHPAHYRWSSYRANALGEADALVTPHAVYCALGRSAEERRAAYRRACAAPRSRAPRPAC
jgi:putative transposase